MVRARDCESRGSRFDSGKNSKFENSNLHGFELSRPSSKGTKLLLQITKAIINQQRVTDSLFATIPLWYSLFGVGYVSLRVWKDCSYDLWTVTGVILSQNTSARQPLCARYFLQVGWSCWPYSTPWMKHRTVPMVDTSLQSAGSCLWGSWFFELVFDDIPAIY